MAETTKKSFRSRPTHSLSNFNESPISSSSTSNSTRSLSRSNTVVGYSEETSAAVASHINNTIQQLQDQQERVQKKTFTNWINSYLHKHVPASKVTDLFVDIREGIVLLYLLETLSGETLPIEKGTKLKRVHFLSNVTNALQFLQSRKIKLVNINATDIVDGKPSIVLGLVWTIILYFQIEENTRLLARRASRIQDDQMYSISVPLAGDAMKRGSPKQAMLHWAQQTVTLKYGVPVTDLGPSWRDGIAFNAIIHNINPHLVEMSTLHQNSPRVNLENAFRTAEEHLGIPRLMDPEDVDVDKPDERSIMTYLAKFLEKFSEDSEKTASEANPALKEENDLDNLLRWLQNAIDLLVSVTDKPITNQEEEYQAYQKFLKDLNCRSHIYEQLQKKVETRCFLRITPESWNELQKNWNSMATLTSKWQRKLDGNLPGRLGEIGDWLHEFELVLDTDMGYGEISEEAVEKIADKLKQLKGEFKQLEYNHKEVLLAKQSRKYEGVALPMMQILNLDKRFCSLSAKSELVIKKLEYEEAKYMLLLKLNSTEVLACPSKFNQLSDLETFFQIIKNSRQRDDLEKRFVEFKKYAGVLKNEYSQDHPEKEAFNQELSEIQMQFETTNHNFSSLQIRMEDTINLLSHYNSIVGDFESWHSEAEQTLKKPLQEQQKFFDGMDVWSTKVQHLKDISDNLLQLDVMDELLLKEIQNKVNTVGSIWNKMLQNAHSSREMMSISVSQLDYNSEIGRLSAALEHAEQVLMHIVNASGPDFEEHISNLKVTYALKDELSEMLKTAEHISHHLTKDSSGNFIKEMKEEIDYLKERHTKVFREIKEKDDALSFVLPTIKFLDSKMSEVLQFRDKENILFNGKITEQLSNAKDFVNEMKNQNEIIQILKAERKQLEQSPSTVYLNLQSLDNSIETESKRIHEQVKFYETIVNNNLTYIAAVAQFEDWKNELEEKLELNFQIRGDFSEIQIRLKKFKNSQILLKEGETRMKRVVGCSQEVMSNTLNIRQDIILKEVNDMKVQLMQLEDKVLKMRDELEQCLTIWKDFNRVDNDCRTATKNMETRLRNMELQPTLATKQKQLNKINQLYGDFSKNGDSIDDLCVRTDVVADLMSDTLLSVQMNQLSARYMFQLSTIKEIMTVWERFVIEHQCLDDYCHRFKEWMRDATSRLTLCMPSKEDKFTLEIKLNRMKELNTFKEEGFSKLDDIVNHSEVVVHNTSAIGRDFISKNIADLRTSMKDLVNSMNRVKEQLEVALLNRKSFEEDALRLTNWIHEVEQEIVVMDILPETAMEQKMQMEKLKILSLKVFNQQLEFISILQKGSEVAKSAIDNKDTQMVMLLDEKYNSISKQIQAMMQHWEKCLTEHQSFQVACFKTRDWLNKGYEKLISCNEVCGDCRLLLSKQDQIQNLLMKIVLEGEIRVQEVMRCCDIIMKVVSAAGQKRIREGADILTDEVERCIATFQEKAFQLRNMIDMWKKFNNMYEIENDWLSALESKTRRPLAPKSSLSEKQEMMEEYRYFLQEILNHTKQLTDVNDLSQLLLETCPDARLMEQVAQFRTRYATLLSCSKDNLKKFEHEVEDHVHFKAVVDAFKSWIQSAKDELKEYLLVAKDKDALHSQLNQFYGFSAKKENAIILMLSVDAYGKKTMLNTSAIGSSQINQSLCEIQQQWHNFLTSLAEVKLKLETSLMKWSDINTRTNQLKSWIKEMTERVQDVEQLTSLSEKKSQLYKLKALHKEILFQEHAVASLKLEAVELSSVDQKEDCGRTSITSDVHLITKEYQFLLSEALTSVNSCNDTLEQHTKYQEIFEQCSDWLHISREALATCDPQGDLALICQKISILETIEHGLVEGNKLVNETKLAAADVYINTSPTGCSHIKEELDVIISDFEDFHRQTVVSRTSLLSCQKLWEEYDTMRKNCSNWLEEKESNIKMELTYGDTPEEKEIQYQINQDYHDDIKAHQEDMDQLKQKAKEVHDILSRSPYISQDVTEFFHRYQSILLNSQESMKKLKAAYEAHLQYNQARSSYMKWLEDVEDRVNEAHDLKDERGQLETRLAGLMDIESSLGKDHAKMLTIREHGNMVILRSSPTGAEEVRQQMKELNVNFENLKIKLTAGKKALESSIGTWALFEYNWDKIQLWLNETEQNLLLLKPRREDNDPDEMKTKLKQTKKLLDSINGYKSEMDNLQSLSKNLPLTSSTAMESLKHYELLRDGTFNDIVMIEQQVANYDEYNDYRQLISQQLEQLLTDGKRITSENISIDERMNRLKALKLSVYELASRYDDFASFGGRISDNMSDITMTKISEEIKKIRDDLDCLLSTIDQTELALCDLCEYTEDKDKLLSWIEVAEERIKNNLKNTSFLSLDQSIQDIKALYLDVCENQDLEIIRAKSERVIRATRSSSPDQDINKEMDDLVQRFTALKNHAEDAEQTMVSLKQDVDYYNEMVDNRQIWLDESKKLFDQNKSYSGCEAEEEIQTKLNILQDLLSALNEQKCTNDLTVQYQLLLDQMKPAECEISERKLRKIEEDCNNFFNKANFVASLMRSWLDRHILFSNLTHSIEEQLLDLEQEGFVLYPTSDLTIRLDQLNKLKMALVVLDDHKGEIKQMQHLAVEFSTEHKNGKWKKKADELEKCFMRKKMKLESDVQRLQLLCDLQQNYIQSHKNCEKKLVFFSLKFSAHKSVCIQTYEATQSQFSEHKILISELKSCESSVVTAFQEEGQKLIDDFENFDDIKQNIETQMATIVNACHSLKMAANQIKERLGEAIEEWQGSDRLADECNSYINTQVLPTLFEDVPCTSCQNCISRVNEIQIFIKNLLNFSEEISRSQERLKSFLCSDTNLHLDMEPLPVSLLQQKIRHINERISQVLSQLGNRQSSLKDMECLWLEADKLKLQLNEWLIEKHCEILELSNRSAEFHPDIMDLEIMECERLLLELQEKAPTIEKLVIRYTRLIPGNPDQVQVLARSIQNQWESLISTLKKHKSNCQEILITRKSWRLSQSVSDLEDRYNQIHSEGMSSENKKHQFQTATETDTSQTLKFDLESQPRKEEELISGKAPVATIQALEVEKQKRACSLPYFERLNLLHQKLKTIGKIPSEPDHYKEKLKQLEDFEPDLKSLESELESVKHEWNDVLVSEDSEDPIDKAISDLQILKEDARDCSHQFQTLEDGRRKKQEEFSQIQTQFDEVESWFLSASQHTIQTGSSKYLQKHFYDVTSYSGEVKNKLTELNNINEQLGRLLDCKGRKEESRLEEKIRSLTIDLSNFNESLAQKLIDLKKGIERNEKREKEMRDLEENVNNIQKIILKTITLSDFPSEDDLETLKGMKQPSKHLQQMLQSGILEERELLKSVITTGEQQKSVIDKPSSTIHPFTVQLRSSRLLETEIQKEVADLRKHWENFQNAERCGTEEYLSGQQHFVNIATLIFQWMDCIEGQHQKTGTVADLHDLQRQTKLLRLIEREMKDLLNISKDIGQSLHEKLPPSAQQHDALIRKTMEDVDGRLCLLEEEGKRMEQQALEKRKWLEKLQDSLKSVVEETSALQKQYLSLSDPTRPIHEKLKACGQLDTDCSEVLWQLDALKTEAELMFIQDPAMSVTTELFAYQHQLINIHDKITEKKNELSHMNGLCTQYEMMLEQYADFLETAHEKVGRPLLYIMEMSQLQEQLLMHKSFFQELSNQQNLLDTLAMKLIPQEKERFHLSHSRLNMLRLGVLEKASSREIKLKQAIDQWIEFEPKFNGKLTWLENVEKRKPVEAIEKKYSAETMERRMTILHQIKKDLDTEKIDVNQITDSANKLMTIVACPSMARKVDDFIDRMKRLNSEVTDKLKHLEYMTKQFKQFESETKLIESWLKKAKNQQDDIKKLLAKDKLCLEELKQAEEFFSELKRDCEEYQGHKMSVVNLGNKLMRYHPSDSNISERLCKLDENWTSVMNSNLETDNQLRNAQKALLPSCQALGEILQWLASVQQVVNDDLIVHPENQEQVAKLLKKYRSLKMDLLNHQLTIEYINKIGDQKNVGESLSFSGQTVSAEHLGEMNKQYQMLCSDINNKAVKLEMASEMWKEYENTVKDLQEWLNDATIKISKEEETTSLEELLRTCKEMSDEFELKKNKDFELVKHLGSQLIKMSNWPANDETIWNTQDRLTNQWTDVTDKLNYLKRVAEKRERLLDGYKIALDGVIDVMDRTNLSLTGMQQNGGCNVASLREEITELKNLQKEFIGSEEALKKLTNSTTALEIGCERVFHSRLDQATESWKQLKDSLVVRLSNLEKLCVNWSKYDDMYEESLNWISMKETEMKKILIDDMPDEWNRHIANVKENHDKIRVFRQRLLELDVVMKEIIPQLDNAKLVHIMSDKSQLDQRTTNLKGMLDRQLHELDSGAVSKKKCLDKCNELELFLTEAKEAVALTKLPLALTTKADVVQEKLDLARVLSGRFSRTRPTLFEVNQCGYRLSLSSAESDRIKKMNDLWQILEAKNNDDHKQLQQQLLLLQSFADKCSEWNEYLAQVEKDLSVDVYRSYESIVEQQQKLESFQREIYPRQQILFSIISDGHKLNKNGSNEDDFGLKLHLLEEQWQTVIRQIGKHKMLVDSVVTLWQTYHELFDKLSDTLADIRKYVDGHPITATSCSSIRNLLDKYKDVHNQLLATEATFDKLRSYQSLLLPTNDAAMVNKLEFKLNALDNEKQSLNRELSTNRSQVEELLSLWVTLQSNMENFVISMKGIKQFVLPEVPTKYDLLQDELKKLEKLEADKTDRCEGLTKDLEKLADFITPEDSLILCQRLRLLAKQQTEISNQVVCRCQEIRGRLNRWSEFDNMSEQLLTDFTSFQQKLEMVDDATSIEDSISIIQTELLVEISNLEKHKGNLLELGKKLIQDSTDFRVSNIEHKMADVSECWIKLKEILNSRLDKLTIALTTLQQLEKRMKDLRQWLLEVEYHLSCPIVYEMSDNKEIKCQMTKHMEFQKQVDNHTQAILSVLSLCESLSSDKVACSTPVQADALQQARDTLEIKWKNILKMLVEKKQEIEETDQLWNEFQSNHQVFTKWLTLAEKQILSFKTEDTSFKALKEEKADIQKLHKVIQEHLAELDALNRIYCRLAHEGRTDMKGTIKQKINDANHRWDEISARAAIVIRRFAHLINIREDFDVNHHALMLWLSSFHDVLTELNQINGRPNDNILSVIRGELADNSGRMQYIDRASSYLMQKFESSDAAQIQQNVDDFHNLHHSVLQLLQNIEYCSSFSSHPTNEEFNNERIQDLETKLKRNINDISIQLEAAVSRLDSDVEPDLDTNVGNGQGFTDRHKYLNQLRGHLSPCDESIIEELDELEEWLLEAEVLLEMGKKKPKDMAQFEQCLIKHKDLMGQIDDWKTKVFRIRSTMSLISHHTQLSETVCDRISSAVSEWDYVCRLASDWWYHLQLLLLQSEEFHLNIEDLMLWLDDVREDVDALDMPTSSMEIKKKKVMDIQQDLHDIHMNYHLLHGLADYFLQDNSSKKAAEDREQLDTIFSKLESIQVMCNNHKSMIDGATSKPFEQSSMGHLSQSFLSPSFHSTTTRRIPRKGQLQSVAHKELKEKSNGETLRGEKRNEESMSNLLKRACRTAIPIQLMMILLIGVASLVPMCENECIFKALDPILKYTDGSPPL